MIAHTADTGALGVSADIAEYKCAPGRSLKFSNPPPALHSRIIVVPQMCIGFLSSSPWHADREVPDVLDVLTSFLELQSGAQQAFVLRGHTLPRARWSMVPSPERHCPSLSAVTVTCEVCEQPGLSYVLWHEIPHQLSFLVSIE